jgi:hypothetical protein
MPESALRTGSKRRPVYAFSGAIAASRFSNEKLPSAQGVTISDISIQLWWKA